MILEDVTTSRELAEFLGVSERSLAQLRIPSIRVGPRRLYFKQTVAEWLKAREGL